MLPSITFAVQKSSTVNQFFVSLPQIYIIRSSSKVSPPEHVGFALSDAKFQMNQGSLLTHNQSSYKSRSGIYCGKSSISQSCLDKTISLTK